MSKRHTLFARTAAAVTTLGAAITGAVVLAAAPANASGLQETNYTFQTSDFGTRVVAEQANLRSDRTAWAVMACTRLAGKYEKVSQASLDTSQTGNPLVDIGAVRSTKQTFVDKANGIRAAVLGTNSIGHISLGDPGTTPVLTIDGLKSTALSWVDTDGKFHAKTTLDLVGVNADLDLVGLDAEQLTGPLNELFKAIQTDVLDNVIAVLADNDGGIEIPGLGKVYLPGGANYFHREIVKQQKGTAQASVKALRILLYGLDGVEGGGDDSEVTVGRAWSRISKAPSGVMVGHGYGVSAEIADGLVGIGRVAFQPLPCWGTENQTRDQHTANLDILKQGFVQTGDIFGRVLGAQFPDGSATAWTQGSVANVQLSLDGTEANTLVIEAITARANLVEKANGQLVKAPQDLADRFGVQFGNIDGTKILGVSFGGEDLGSFSPGDSYTITDSANNPLIKIVFGEVRPLKRGLEVVGAHVYVLDSALSEDTGVIDVKLGVAKTRIKKY